MSLKDYLNQNLIKINSEIKNKEEALRQIAELAKKSSLLQETSIEDIYQNLLKREDLASTGIGNGLAIPHFALEGLNEFVIGMLISKEGIEFSAIDGNPVNIFLFIIAPQAKRNEHIRVLSEISKIFKIKNNADTLLSLDNENDIYQFILKFSKEKTKDNSIFEYQHFCIIVQEEEKFNDILEIFTELNDCFISVVEGKNASQYLHQLPLFSSFWNDTEKGYHKIILANINKSFSNEIIRKINMIIDEIKNKTGIMVMVQDVLYSNGTLNL